MEEEIIIKGRIGHINKEIQLADLLHGQDPCKYIETLILYHGAPTIQGVKPANLLNIRSEGVGCFSCWSECKERLSQKLGIQFREMKVTEKGKLLFLYRPELLAPRFWCKSTQNFLEGYGYPVGSLSLEAWLDHLQERFQQEACPHEIGLFLGYPPRDVCEFIRCNGACQKGSGLWKIYGNVGRAQRKFRKYKEATHFIGNLLYHGAGLEEIQQNLRKRPESIAL